MQNAEYKSIPVLHEQMSGDGDSFKSLKEDRLKSLNRIVLADLNINSLRNKFDALAKEVSSNVDVWSYPKQKPMSHFLKANLKFLNFAPLFVWIKLNFLKNKWLLSCSYNPSKSNIISHLEHLRRSLDLYPANYYNLLLMGDFNVNPKELNMKDFCDSYGFKSLIKVSACFKNPENPSCIDLKLTNNPLSFQSSGVIETGLSDFHKMIVTVMKTPIKS